MADKSKNIDELARQYGEIRAYNPTIADELRNYWYNTPAEEKFMDSLGAGLSLASGVAPAIKGLQAASIAAKASGTPIRTFLAKAGQGLAREGLEQAALSQVPMQYQSTANGLANAEDAYRLLKLMR